MLDEVGFGTKEVLHHGYSLVGTPVLKVKQNTLASNMTCCAVISARKVEALKFFTSGGTKKEMF